MINCKSRLLALLFALLMLLPGAAAEEAAHPVVCISVRDVGDIYAELCPEYAPITVENFLSLVESGFYDGLTFHRIIDGFMVQGGDPLGNGTGGSSKKIQGEFSMNGVENPLKHERGVLSMARSQAMDSASCQFFIMHDDAPHLDGSYAAFGRVIAGQWVVDRLCQETPVTDNNGTVAPGHQPVMDSVRVADRAEAEAAAEREALNGRSGGVFADPVSPLSFPVPEGWNLATEGPHSVSILHGEETAAGAVRLLIISRQNNWDCLSDAYKSQLEAHGMTRESVDTEAFRKDTLAGTVHMEADQMADETHSGVLLYTGETVIGGTQATVFVGANDGYIYCFTFTGLKSDPLFADVMEMLDHMTFREDF